MKRQLTPLLATFLMTFGLPWVSGAAIPLGAQAPGDSVRPAVASQIRAIRTQRAPSIDGRLADDEWKKARVATGFTQFRPTPGEPASKPTRVRILYDDDAVYIGARMVDDPDSVVTQVAQRDEFVYSDRLFVLFDSYNDDRTAFGFGVTPAGSRFDIFFSGDTNQDANWDAVWSAEARVDSLGWTAEMRIPLAQLGFEPVSGNQSATWGFNVMREIARKRERSSWAPFDPNVSRLVSQFGSLRGLRNLPSTTHLEVMPYSASRATRDGVDPNNPLQSPTEWSGNVGADVRYGITPNVSLRATINPDFGQVEADPSKINLTAFETFFPEKRPFFVEGADIFSTQGPRLFYSRRIGQEPSGPRPSDARYVDSPQRTTIRGAAKLTGRTAGGWEVGALEAVTTQEQAAFVAADGTTGEATIAPRTNYGVARVRKNVRGGRSTVGGIFTATNRLGLPSRLEGMHTAAYTGGIDGRHRFADETYEASGAIYGSQVRGSTNALQATQASPTHYFQRPDADHLAMDTSRTQMTGWNARAEVNKIAGQWRWNTQVSAISPDFEINDLGYLRSADALSEEVGVTYVNNEPGRGMRSVRAWLRHQSEWTFGHERTNARLSYGSFATLENNVQIGLRGSTELSGLSTTALRGGPALRENGSTRIGLSFETDGRKDLQAELGGRVRSDFGSNGYGVSVQPRLRYRPTQRASLSIEPALRLSRDPAQYVSTVETDDGPRYVFGELERRTVSITTRASYAFTPEMTLELYAQPFVATGDYGRFAEISDPDAQHLSDRLDRFGNRVSRTDKGTYRLPASGSSSYSFPDPDFTFEQLRSTVVFRWQYRRGSTLHLVWNHETTNYHPRATPAPTRAFGNLLGGGRNTFVVKLNYWLGL